MRVEIVDAQYDDPKHAGDLIFLLDAYARDPMGGGQPLESGVKRRLADELSKRSDAFSILAYVDGQPVGLVNCFEGFSTFKAKPLVNIHDVVVLPGHRGAGLAQRMLERVEAIAIQRGCCKLTLEVLAENRAAQSAYRRFGFLGYQLIESGGQAWFWEKQL